jgi:hypothetical protein
MSADPALELPRLREVEAVPAADGRVCLRDPLGFSDKLLLLPPQALFIVSLFDGRHAPLDIQTEYARRFGDLADQGVRRRPPARALARGNLLRA